MAKSVIIENLLGMTNLYTEGLNDVLTIREKFYYANQLAVIITFGSSPTITYYNCKCLISQDLTLNQFSSTSQLLCCTKLLSATDLKTDGQFPFLPAPPTGLAILPLIASTKFYYKGIAYTNSNSGGLYIKSGATAPATALFTFTLFKGTTNYITSFLINANYLNNTYDPTIGIDYYLNCTNVTGNSTLLLKLYYTLSPNLY